MTTTNDLLLLELQKISRLLVRMVTRDQTQRQNIEDLSKLGFSPKEIADFLGTTPNTVSVALSELRKKSRSKAPESKQRSKDDKQEPA